jgi:hypothetical protein
MIQIIIPQNLGDVHSTSLPAYRLHSPVLIASLEHQLRHVGVDGLVSLYMRRMV